MDCITQVAFGINADALNNPDTDFVKNTDIMFETWRFLLQLMCPLICYIFKIGFLSPKVKKFIMNVSKNVIDERDAKNIKRDDVVGLMMKIRDEGYDTKLEGDMDFGLGKVKAGKLENDTIYKSLMQFFTDGYESIGAYVSLMLYYLATNPEVQDTAIAEVDEVSERCGDTLSGEDVNSLKYLEQVFCETGRASPLAFTGRICTKDWTIPNTDIVIPKGTRVTIPISAFQLDPEYFPEPEKFKPERFS